jgi:hypothetical protein
MSVRDGGSRAYFRKQFRSNDGAKRALCTHVAQGQAKSYFLQLACQRRNLLEPHRQVQFGATALLARPKSRVISSVRFRPSRGQKPDIDDP